MTLFLPNDRTRGSRGSKRVPAKEALGAALSAWCRGHRLSLAKEHKGIPGRGLSFDWAIVELDIAIEFEGGMFGVPGAKRCPVCNEMPKVSHFAIGRIKTDAEKYNLAAIYGWCVIRIIPTMIDTAGNCDKAMAFISQAVEQRRARR